MNKHIVIASGAIFSMFFGSGNIVFPLMLAGEYKSATPMAFFGFCLTGIVMPIFGLIIMVLLEGNTDKFFKPLTNKVSIIMQLIILGIFGPLAVCPRCLSVALGGFRAINETIPNITFYSIVSILLLFVAINKEKVMPIIGKILTPIKVGLITVVLLVGIYKAPVLIPDLTIDMSFFPKGISAGYQTMDFLGALYFSALAYSYLKDNSNNKSELLSMGVKASLISGAMLAAIYLAFFWLGVSYADLTKGLAGPDILPKIATLSMGSYGGFIVGTTIIVTCMVTAVSLVTVWSEYVHRLLKNVIPYKLVISVSVAIIFCISHFIGFTGIYKKLTPALEIIYPVVMLVALYNLIKIIGSRKNGYINNNA